MSKVHNMTDKTRKTVYVTRRKNATKILVPAGFVSKKKREQSCRLNVYPCRDVVLMKQVGCAALIHQWLKAQLTEQFASDIIVVVNSPLLFE